MADVDTGMDMAKMKQLLAVSKKQPINCAVGVTKTGAVMMLDKIKPPKSLVKDLEKKFHDMKTPNWGTAFVDTDEDPKLVILTLEKAPAGIGRKLKKTLKGTGFSKVEIRGEDGTVAEKVGEEEEEGAEAAGGQAAATAAAPPAPDAAAAPATSEAEAEPDASAATNASAAPDASAAADTMDAAAEPAATEQAAAAEEPAAPAAAASGLDPAMLTRRLTDLVKQMVPILTADPARGQGLKALAMQAQSALKSGDMEHAQSAIGDFQTALSGPASPASGADGAAAAAPAASPAPAAAAANGAAPPNMAALGKAKLAWSAARKKMESEVEKLHAEMTKHYKDHGFGGELDKFFSAKVEPMMNNLDESLVQKLDEVTKNTDPAAHTKLVGEAKTIIKGYEAYLAGEPIIKKLDENPFVPLAIGKTLTATLEALSRAVV